MISRWEFAARLLALALGFAGDGLAGTWWLMHLSPHVSTPPNTIIQRFPAWT